MKDEARTKNMGKPPLGFKQMFVFAHIWGSDAATEHLVKTDDCFSSY